MLLQETASWLEKDKNKITKKVSQRIYEVISSYKNGNMPIEESMGTVTAALEYIINLLKDKNASIDKGANNLVTDIIKFEEGIASKRVIYSIDLEDLLHGIRVFRDEVWSVIGQKLKEKNIAASEFIKLENRINTFFVYLMTRIAGSYNKTMTDIIGIQSLDLQKWEEVIKSASSIELKIPCRGEFAAIVRLQAEAIARRLQYTEEEIQDIKVSVGEACDNAIEHGISDKGIDVHYHLDMKEMKVEVIDYGKGFDPKGKGEEPPDLFSERGRGIFLFKVLMDRNEIYSKPGEGTMVILAKNRVFR